MARDGPRRQRSKSLSEAVSTHRCGPYVNLITARESSPLWDVSPSNLMTSSGRGLSRIQIFVPGLGSCSGRTPDSHLHCFALSRTPRRRGGSAGPPHSSSCNSACAESPGRHPRGTSASPTGCPYLATSEPPPSIHVITTCSPCGFLPSAFSRPIVAGFSFGTFRGVADSLPK
jgi:hypothetical protein